MKQAEYKVKTAAELQEEISKAQDSKVTFSKQEAQQLLDIMIEDECQWSLRKFYPKSYENKIQDSMYPSYGGATTTDASVPADPTPQEFNAIVDRVYRYIVKEWRYNPVTLEICRKAKFSKQMVADCVQECADRMKAETELVGKALGRSLLRVAEFGIDISKGVEFEDIVKTGVARPERVYIFLKSREEENPSLIIEKGGPGSGRRKMSRAAVLKHAREGRLELQHDLPIKARGHVEVRYTGEKHPLRGTTATIDLTD